MITLVHWEGKTIKKINYIHIYIYRAAGQIRRQATGKCFGAPNGQSSPGTTSVYTWFEFLNIYAHVSANSVVYAKHHLPSGTKCKSLLGLKYTNTLKNVTH